MGKLDNKTALITGGTSGMGAAFAKLFSEEGAEVIIVGRNKERAEQVTKELKKGNYYICDVSDEKQVIELKDWFLKNYTKLDILLNNAGVFITSPLEEIETDDWIKTFNINTNSVMYMTKHFISLLKKSHGCILNNASNAGLSSYPKGRATYGYASSKAAVIQFSQKCAVNYSDRIRVNCICPGVIDTPLFTNRDFSRFKDSIPMGRVGQPEEVAKAALFLCSDDASYISGAVLTVDGAASLK